MSLISQPNFSASNAASFNVSVSFTGATPTGASLGGSFANASRRYTDTPATLIADGAFPAYAGRNTLLAGAGMWSKTGNLKLDTGDPVMDNYRDKDTSLAVSGGISLNLNPGTNRPWDGNLPAQYKNLTALTFAPSAPAISTSATAPNPTSPASTATPPTCSGAHSARWAAVCPCPLFQEGIRPEKWI